MATMRYLGDVIADFVLAAIICAWAALRWAMAQPRWTRVVAHAGFHGSALLTLVAGVLLGFEGYLNHYATHNPEYPRLAALLSCKSR
jgi:hypothetical protein